MKLGTCNNVDDSGFDELFTASALAYFAFDVQEVVMLHDYHPITKVWPRQFSLKDNRWVRFVIAGVVGAGVR